MKKLASLLALPALLAASSTAFAQTKMFEGFYGQVSTGYENNTISSTNANYTVDNNPPYSGMHNTSNQAASGMPLVLGLGYNFALSSQWVLGLGADYSALSQKTSVFSSNNPQVPGPYGYTNGQNIQISNRYNIVLSPGYVIDQDKLMYAKVGYSNQQIQFNTPAQQSSSSYAPSATQSGYVVGLGYKQIISGGLYLFGEANYMGYSNASLSSTVLQSGGPSVSVNRNPSASAYTILIGAGYKF